MSGGGPQVGTGLSLRVAGVELVAVIDAEAGTVRIQQRGETVNGNAAAIEAARTLLAGRVKRFLPQMRILE